MIQLFQYPHETLLQKSTTWKKDDSIQGYDDIEKFEHDYVKLMLDENGMGLAANQVGITKRFFAIGHETFDTFQKHAIIWNPKVINFSRYYPVRRIMTQKYSHYLKYLFPHKK